MGHVKLELKVPKTVVSALGMSASEMASDFCQRVAVSLHMEGVLSLGKAAEMAGLPYTDFMALLRAKKVPLNYTVEDLAEDIRNLREVTTTRMVGEAKVMREVPVIEGTRTTVAHVLERLAAGESPAEVARAHPGLTEDGVKAALEYAARVLRQGFALRDPLGLYDDWDDRRVDEAYDQGR